MSNRTVVFWTFRGLFVVFNHLKCFCTAESNPTIRLTTLTYSIMSFPPDKPFQRLDICPRLGTWRKVQDLETHLHSSDVGARGDRANGCRGKAAWQDVGKRS